jgi:hypothetical protein
MKSMGYMQFRPVFPHSAARVALRFASMKKAAGAAGAGGFRSAFARKANRAQAY